MDEAPSDPARVPKRKASPPAEPSPDSDDDDIPGGLQRRINRQENETNHLRRLVQEMQTQLADVQTRLDLEVTKRERAEREIARLRGGLPAPEVQPGVVQAVSGDAGMEVDAGSARLSDIGFPSVPGNAEEVRMSQPQTASPGDDMELGQTSLLQQDPLSEKQKLPEGLQSWDKFATSSAIDALRARFSALQGVIVIPKTSAEPQDVEMTDDPGADASMLPSGEQTLDVLIAKMDSAHRQEVQDLERRYASEADAAATALRLKDEELGKAKLTVRELESVLSQKQKDIMALNNEKLNLASVAERVVELERQLAAPHVGQKQIAGPLEKHEERMDQSDDDTAWLRERVATLEGEKQGLQQDILDECSMVDDRVPELQADLKRLIGRADELEKLEESAKETISLGGRLSKAQRRIDTLHGENEDLNAKLIDSERKVRALNIEIKVPQASSGAYGVV
ncbi:hypothetical protein FB107DRAFT_280345 [Schizophyllum commune]